MPLQFSIFDVLASQQASGLALRDYQQAALAAISSYAEQGGRRGLVAMATGLGKTVIFSALPGSLGDRRMLVIAHREELLDQAAAKIQQANPALHVGIEQADRHAPPGSNVVVASVQTLAMGNGRRLQALDASRYGVVVVDEAHHCHHALAPISMMGYTKPIKDVHVGDRVRCWVRGEVGYRKVTRKYIHASPAILVRLRTESGRTVVATSNHRMVTPNGKQEIGEWMDLLCVQQDDPVTWEGEARVHAPRGLQGMVRGAASGRDECKERQSVIQGISESPDEWRPKPNEAITSGFGEDAVQYKRTNQAGRDTCLWGKGARERLTPYRGGEAFCFDFPAGGSGVHCDDARTGGKRISPPLQTGFCVSSYKNSSRNRREFAFCQESASGQTEAGMVGTAGMDLLSIDERTGALWRDPVVAGEWIDGGGLVYDIEVEEAHNYFVDGLLSSNSTARTYVQCLAHFGLAPDLSDIAGYDDARSARREVRDRFEAFSAPPDAPLLLGFTATPNRSDGGGLDAVFDEIVYSMDIRAGMESGWLCPIIGRRIKTASSLDEVKTRHGDYAEAELADAVDTPERNALAVAAYQEHAAGRQALVFAVNVEHTRNLLAAFQAAGIPAGMVVGETAPDSRQEAVRAYKAGELRVLVNCMVLTEGFDAPETSCIVMARPTKSSLLYTQMLGRGTRLSPGNPNKNLLVLDMVDVARKAGAASLNTIFGLPPRYELGGSDVLAAKRATEEYEDAIPQGEFEGLENLDQVKRAAEEFDPLRSVGLPEWFAERTRLAWIKTAYGFALGVMGAGQLGIVVDMLGHCRIRLKQPRQRPELIGAAPDVLSALAEADAWVAQYAGRAPDGERLARVMQRDARWRTDAASEKQIAFLKKLGAKFPQDISKGQASALIDAALGRKA